MNLDLLKRLRWDGGKLFAFSAMDGGTDYRRGLVGRSAHGRAAIEIKFPGPCEIRFGAATEPLDCEHCANTVAGDWFELKAGARTVRGAFLDAHHMLIEGPCEVAHAAPEITFAREGAMTLVGAADFFHAPNVRADFNAAWEARQMWLSRLPEPPAAARGAAAMAYAKCVAQMKTQVCSPEGAITRRWTTPDRWPHKEMWLWDSAFHAIGWRHLDPAAAADALSAVLEAMEPDGFIPHMRNPSGNSAVTQPPVLALGAVKVFEKTGDLGWLARAYPRLKAYLEWDFANRDRDEDGLLEWMIEPDPECRSGESGLDNSPRFDDSQLLAAVDFNSFAALECETLAHIADLLGRADEAAGWRKRHSEICALISEKLWNAERGFFFDYDAARQAFSPVLAVTGFFPLICGAATPEQAEELAEALNNPALFGAPFRIPSISPSDSKYKPDMWKGPVWINANWLVAMGLERYGFAKDASALRDETRAWIVENFTRFGTAFEFYDAAARTDPPALMRKGVCDPASPYHQVIHDYGWTAALFVDMLFEP